MPHRAAFYIDGFNLYHAIDELNQPHLKWLDLWALGTRLITPDSELVRIVWCTAIDTKNVPKMLRHREYRKAVESTGVIAVEGHFTVEDMECRECGHVWAKRTEKQGDVNVAVNLISDGHAGLYDCAYLLTADSDQAATARIFRDRLPEKRIVSVAPPMREHSFHVLQHTHDKKAISVSDLEWCLFPNPVLKGGAFVCARPNEYEPPRGWKNPRAAKISLPKKVIEEEAQLAAPETEAS
jgi:hypothetical protein